MAFAALATSTGLNSDWNRHAMSRRQGSSSGLRQALKRLAYLSHAPAEGIEIDIQRGIISPQVSLTHHPDHFLGWYTHSDEGVDGPLFNYARIFTWSRFAHHVHEKAREMLISSMDSSMLYSITSTSEKEMSAFPIMMDGNLLGHMLCASIVALILQFGTTGPVFVLSYLTHPVGFGCQSAAYLLYAILSISSWITLVFAALLSQIVMDEHGYPWDQPLNPPISTQVRFLAFAAFTLQIMGQALAIGNAGWLLVFTIMMDDGTIVSNCWCATLGLSRSIDHAWAPFFLLVYHKDAAWIGTFVISGVAVIGTALFYYVFARRCK